MITVTFFARRCVGVILGPQDTVHAFLKNSAYLRVTSRAVNWFCNRITRSNVRRIHLVVALAARHIRVPGIPKFTYIHEERFPAR